MDCKAEPAHDAHRGALIAQVAWAAVGAVGIQGGGLAGATGHSRAGDANVGTAATTAKLQSHLRRPCVVDGGPVRGEDTARRALQAASVKLVCCGRAAPPRRALLRAPPSRQVHRCVLRRHEKPRQGAVPGVEWLLLRRCGAAPTRQPILPPPSCSLQWAHTGRHTLHRNELLGARARGPAAPGRAVLCTPLAQRCG